MPVACCNKYLNHVFPLPWYENMPQMIVKRSNMKDSSVSKCLCIVYYGKWGQSCHIFDRRPCCDSVEVFPALDFRVMPRAIGFIWYFWSVDIFIFDFLQFVICSYAKIFGNTELITLFRSESFMIYLFKKFSGFRWYDFIASEEFEFLFPSLRKCNSWHHCSWGRCLRMCKSRCLNTSNYKSYKHDVENQNISTNSLNIFLIYWNLRSDNLNFALYVEQSAPSQQIPPHNTYIDNNKCCYRCLSLQPNLIGIPMLKIGFDFLLFWFDSCEDIP